MDEVGWRERVFPVGTTTITYTATDSAGRTAAATQRVTIIDNTSPVITLNGRTITWWPPDHKYKTVSVPDLVAGASDNCDPRVTLGKVVIAQVSSDEPDRGNCTGQSGGNCNGNSDDETVDDILIAADCKSVRLRAERDGNRNGRVYTITFKVKDESGNVRTATARITVPKSPIGSPAVDDGANHAVMGNCP